MFPVLASRSPSGLLLGSTGGRQRPSASGAQGAMTRWAVGEGGQHTGMQSPETEAGGQRLRDCTWGPWSQPRLKPTPLTSRTRELTSPFLCSGELELGFCDL